MLSVCDESSSKLHLSPTEGFWSTLLELISGSSFVSSCRVFNGWRGDEGPMVIKCVWKGTKV